MVNDDRAEFEAKKRNDAKRMAADPELRAEALSLNVAADRYDWTYQWSWLGLPVIQMPPDIVGIQEIIWETKPQLIIESGIARGGSLILSASLLQLLGEGEVVGIDVDIRAHNRTAIEEHPLAHRVTMIEGSSLDPSVVAQVRALAKGVERVMVVLDSNHTHDHVLAELEFYAPTVTIGQFLVVADTFIDDIPVQEHRPRTWGPGNSPGSALDAWLAAGGESASFERDKFMNSKLLLSASAGGYLRRTR